MTYLVGDIGGTNTRLALADVTGVQPASVMRASNDAYESFDAVLSSYLQKTDPDSLAGVCVAIAGPVQAGKGTLTNRNWSLDVDSLRAQARAPHAELINDLSALGYALARVSTEHVFGTHQGATNGQRLVVGMGTGFNVSPTRATASGVTAMESELGHAELPYSVSQLLQDALGAAAQPFNTYEDCFSGRGLERLHEAVSGEKQDGKSIMESFAAGQTDAQRTVLLFARALGRMTQSVIHQFMPRDGIAFAGSASRGVLTSKALPAFVEELTADHHGIVDAHQFPISLITEDVAALEGCLQYLSQTS
ncbi:ROK family protein [Shimia sp. R11_0]|uniref:glucokinase n=1 Tax=Shimia sp. R11_0 TaxID=2821096 RepID=UPI001ADA7B6B|nr:ROK family protein [Shimia sp. R11_0]MBO9477589.1 ROK family protein [Shimia sp. R11_0]